MKIECKHLHTILSADNGYAVARFKADSPVLLPDGSESVKFTAKGYHLPINANEKCELEGNFELYKRKNGSDTYTLRVTSCCKILPSDEDAIIVYLRSLSGVGKSLARKIYDMFGTQVFSVMENDPASLSRVDGISEKKAKRVALAHKETKSMRELIQYMSPYHVNEKRLANLYRMFGPNVVSQIKRNPYCITGMAGIGFQTAEQIAKKEGISMDTPERIEAAILEVLLQSEVGGTLFQERLPFPAFMYDRYLQQPLFDLLYDTEHLYVTGSTYLPRDITYLMTLKLIGCPLCEQDFNKILLQMHLQKKLFLYNEKKGDKIKIKVYRYKTAIAEYHSAKKLIDLLYAEIEPCDDLEKRLNIAEKMLCIKLSDEQKHAVIMGLQNPVSVIAGGPGTGKTSILQVILTVYKGLFPNNKILLMAPTGRAAKRMRESTGYPALTIHNALSLYTDESGNPIARNGDDDMLNCDLIVIDESSMIGSYVFDCLVSRIAPGTRIILVGDVHQLPSIEIGAVLREIIQSNVIPVATLTKTYRQEGGSSIAANAARIKNGVCSLELDEDFIIVEQDESKEIAEKIGELYIEQVEKYSFDDVICLSAYRKKGKSSSNALNHLLQKKIRADITNDAPYIERGNMRIYPGDRIMYTRNTEKLANGDVGVLNNIRRGGRTVDTELDCTFDGSRVTLAGSETIDIELAYATTIHKSQGSEYKVVIMTSDMAHKNMLKRNLIYTGITRAKKKIIIVGQMPALQHGINTQESVYRRSAFSCLLSRFSRERKKNM